MSSVTVYGEARPASWRWRYADPSYFPSMSMKFHESDIDTWKSWFKKDRDIVIELRLNNGQLVRMRRL